MWRCFGLGRTDKRGWRSGVLGVFVMQTRRSVIAGSLMRCERIIQWAKGGLCDQTFIKIEIRMYAKMLRLLRKGPESAFKKYLFTVCAWALMCTPVHGHGEAVADFDFSSIIFHHVYETGFFWLILAFVIWLHWLYRMLPTLCSFSLQHWCDRQQWPLPAFIWVLGTQAEVFILMRNNSNTVNHLFSLLNPLFWNGTDIGKCFVVALVPPGNS